MAIYPNVLKEYLPEIERKITFDDVVDHLIADKFIDKQKYHEIWSQNGNRLKYLLNFVLKDSDCCFRFIKILTGIHGLQNVAYAVTQDIDNIRNVIVWGGFPHFSQNYVVRNSIADEIKDQTLRLKTSINYILVVYGFTGFGKSCLVNQVVQSKSIIESARNAMFWINLGEYQDTTNVINPLWNLYNSAVYLTNEQGLTYRPEDLTTLKNHVKKLFMHDNLKDALIVLDDVKCSQVFDVFDLGCKVIVTTQDKNTVPDNRGKFIKIKTGFAMKESFELLRKSLNTHDLSCKKEKIEQIHELCEGCPMLLNIMGTILRESREEALATIEFWDSIIDEIKVNDYLLDPAIKSGIQRIVDRLQPHEKERFYSLAVFPKHVNIRREILMKLWQISQHNVRQLMVRFEHKCLVVSFFHDDLNTYVYSIHSLVRAYLMEKDEVDIRAYHKTMISIYDGFQKTTINSSKSSKSIDPCVRYIFSYFGYHAKHAGETHRFANYFDLEFIENKIKYVSSTDLIADYDTYREEITQGDPFDGDKLEQFKEFVTSYSTHLHTSPDANIIQFALSYGNSRVFEEARKYAARNADQLYFTLEPYSGRHMHFPQLRAATPVTAVCFLDPEEILLGMRDGTIEIKQFNHYQSNSRLFRSQTKAISRIILSPNRKRFISISLDGSAMLWNINQDLDPQSPVCKQVNWKNVHSPDENIHKNMTFSAVDEDACNIISAAFPWDHSEEAVTASDSGQIIRWNTRTGTKIATSPHRGMPVECICYSHDSQKLIFVYNGNIQIYARMALSYTALFGKCEFNQLHLSARRRNEVIALSRERLELWDYVEKRLVYEFSFDSGIELSMVQDKYLLLAVHGAICMFHLDTHSITTVQNDHGIPSALHRLPESIAFITVNNASIRRCEISLKPNDHPIIPNLDLFCCHWNDTMPIYATVTEANRIDLFSGPSSILSGIDICDKNVAITCMCFSSNGDSLIAGTSAGLLCYYTYKTKTKRYVQLFEASEAINSVKCFGEDTHEIVIVSSDFTIGIASKTTMLQVGSQWKILDFYYVDSYVVYFTENAELNVFNVHSEQTSCVVLNSAPIQTAIHIANHLIAVAYRNDLYYTVDVMELTLPSVQKFIKYEVKSRPTSMALSHNGHVIAVGCQNGAIEVFSVSEKVQGRVALPVLDEGKAVASLVFAQSPQSVLVSVGEQVACWSLTSFESDFSEPLKLSHGLSSLSLLHNKKLNDAVPYLLANVNINGKQLRFISASHNFKAFLIVDRDGNIFKMAFCQ